MSNTDNRLGDVISEIVSDPETRGFTFVSCGPDLGSISHTITDGEYETHVALCAVMLGEHAVGLDVDQTQFVKDVVNEYNSRDFIEQEKWEVNSSDTEPGADGSVNGESK